MSAERVAGLTSLTAGVLLVLVLIGGVVFGAGGVIANGPWPMGTEMMAMDHGMMGMGGGMMGFGTSGPASTPIPSAAEVRVQATNFNFTPSEIRVPKNAEVNLSFMNTAGTSVVHDLTVPALGIHIVASPGETRTVGLRGLPAGRYDAHCSVAGHADLGMRATLIVE